MRYTFPNSKIFLGFMKDVVRFNCVNNLKIEITCKISMMSNVIATSNDDISTDDVITYKKNDVIKYDSKVYFRCEEGYMMGGSDSAVCTESGELQYDDVIPTCAGMIMIIRMKTRI